MLSFASLSGHEVVATCPALWLRGEMNRLTNTTSVRSPVFLPFLLSVTAFKRERATPSSILLPRRKACDKESNDCLSRDITKGLVSWQQTFSGTDKGRVGCNPLVSSGSSTDDGPQCFPPPCPPPLSLSLSLTVRPAKYFREFDGMHGDFARKTLFFIFPCAPFNGEDQQQR